MDRTARRFLVILLLALSPSRAQSVPGLISGSVKDTSGAAIPGAYLTFVDPARRVERTARTNESGAYQVPFLEPGTYRMTVQKDGFKPIGRYDVALTAAQTLHLDFVLDLGVLKVSVQVEDTAAEAHPEAAIVRRGDGRAKAVEVPLSNRNYLQLARLSSSVLSANNRAAQEGSFAVSGARGYQNEVLLDGIDNSARASGGGLGYEVQAVKPPLDAIADFQVIAHNAPAEYGFRIGAKVLVTTRSGTNALHGSAYEYFRNQLFDASNFFANRSAAAKPAMHQNQFGGTLGGPVILNRTYFFGSYQDTQTRRGQNYLSTVPGRSILNGNFSFEPEARRRIFDPLTLTGSGPNAIRSAFPGDAIPLSRFDRTARGLAAMYPAPNIAERENLPDNYFYSPTDRDQAAQYDFRLDHQLLSNQKLFTRYSRRSQNKEQAGTLPFPAMGGQGQDIAIRGQNLAVGVSGLSGRAWHDVRFGWSQLGTDFTIPFDENWNQRLGILGAPGDTFGDGLDAGYARFSPAGFAEIGPRSFWPNENEFRTWNGSASLAIQRGAHTLKFGAEMRRAEVSRSAQRFRRGMMSFSGVYTSEQPDAGQSRATSGNSIADLLLGWASGGMMGNAESSSIVAPYYAGFLQDTWILSTRLSITAGLRWELFQGAYFPHPETQSAVRLLVAGINSVPAGSERLAFPAAGRDCGCRNDWLNFAPRLGVAYQVSSSTVLRLGGGIHYGEPEVLDVEGVHFRPGPPRFVEQILDQPRAVSALRVADGFPLYTAGVVPRNSLIWAFPDALVSMSSAQWFAELQKRVTRQWTLGLLYNGAKGSHLATTRDINQPMLPDPYTRWQDRRIRPEFQSVILQDNSLNSIYQSLTATVERSPERGLTLRHSFTWSHNIDQGDEFLMQGTSGRASQYDLDRERANSSLDRRLAWTMTALYELPFAKGWQMGAVLSVLSGMPLDHRIATDNQNLGGAVRGDWVRSPATAGSVDRWFDTGFVVPGAPGVIGNAGRNLIRGPGLRNLDWVVSKTHLLGQNRGQIQFRFEAFNLTNTTHLGPPNTMIGAPNAGRINTALDPRRIQFAVRYRF